MDRLLVMKSENGNGKYTVLEGNRRAFAMKILKNPAVLTGLDNRPALQKKFEKAAQSFDPDIIEPIARYEVASRAEGRFARLVPAKEVQQFAEQYVATSILTKQFSVQQWFPGALS